jgi:hypothetical protein
MVTARGSDALDNDKILAIRHNLVYISGIDYMEARYENRKIVPKRAKPGSPPA